MPRNERTIPEATPGLLTYDGGFVVADFIADAEFEKSIELTDLPVEDGSLISDHAISKPISGSLTLVQTQTPIYPSEGFSRQQISTTVRSVPVTRQSNPLVVAASKQMQPNASALIRTGVNALFGAVSGAQQIEGFKFGPASEAALSIAVFAADAPVDRVNAFNDELWKLMGPPPTQLVITFKGRSYVDMYLTSVRRSDVQGQLGRSTFACTFKQVVKVVTKQVSLPAVPAARKKVSAGAQGGKQFGPPPPPDNRTFAAALADDGVQLGANLVGAFTGT